MGMSFRYLGDEVYPPVHAELSKQTATTRGSSSIPLNGARLIFADRAVS
jgi:hypothetical protein